MIEHFTKWVELVPLPNKSAYLTTTTFLESVLSRFGAPAEVATDQGSEFKGEFSDMLHHHGIDHRVVSREHPQADGLSERMVQTMTLGLKKSLSERAATDCDMILPYVAIGYRMTVQKSLDYSPYYILFGRHSIFPAKIQECEHHELPDLEDPEALKKKLDARGHAFEELMPLAMRNLAIAQHRDKARFTRVRGGTGGWDRPKTVI